MKKNKKGFTLIEILIALLLLTIVLSAVFSMFTSSIINVNRTEQKSELQAEAQMVLELLNKSGMQAEKISSAANEEGINLLSSSEPSTIRELAFQNSEGTSSFIKEGTKLYYNGGGGINKLLAQHVNNVKISNLNEGNTTYSDCGALKVTITFSSKDVSGYSVTTNIYFRNKN